MNIISAANPQWADAAHTMINLDVDFKEIGPVPFTASADDVEAHGRDLFTRASAGEFGPIAVYVAPPAAIPSVVTMRQARLALLGAGLLATVDGAVAAMPGTSGDAARIEWEFAATVDRNSPLVASLSAALNLSQAQLDGLFSAAAVL